MHCGLKIEGKNSHKHDLGEDEALLLCANSVTVYQAFRGDC